MRTPSHPLPAILFFALLCCAAPLQAQDPGFDAPSTSSAPGFDTTQPVAAFDADAIAIDNARLDLSKQDARDYVKKSHGISVKSDDELLAYKGIFASSRDDAPQLLVVDLDKDELRLYEGSSVRARYKNLGLISKKDAEALDLPSRTLVAQTTQEGTMELVLWRKTTHKGAPARYHMSVFKVIGSYFGKAFSHEIARKPKGEEMIPTAQVEIFHDKGTKALSFGVSTSKTTTLYKWDRWSGTFADPAMQPKATKSGKS